MDVAVDPENREGTRTGDRFELAIRGTSVLLSLHVEADGAPPTAGAIMTALNDLPVDVADAGAVFSALRELPASPVVVGTIRVEPGAWWAVKVSPSRLTAWAVPFAEPDDPDGPELPIVSARELTTRLAPQRVTHGLLQEIIDSFGEGKTLDAPVLLARGLAATPGQNASVEFLFDASESTTPSEHEDGTVDYRTVVVHRFVDEGALLARRHPPVAGVNGRDVSGRELVAPVARDQALAKHQGKGTRIEGDNLVAAIAGRPMLARDRVDVLPVYEVKGNIDFSVGNIDFVGDVVVHGDVMPGFAIHAGGSVTVSGIVDHATVEAGGDIVARGVAGDEHCCLKAGKDIAAHYVHNMHVAAGGVLRVQREVLNCHVECEKLEIPTTGRFVGGRLAARSEVTAGALGSIQSTATWVEVPARVGGKRCCIRATRTVYPGVTLDIGHALLQVQEELRASSFWESGGEIVRFEPGSFGPEDPS